MALHTLDTSIVNVPLLIDGGGSLIGLGIRGRLPISFLCDIQSVSLMGDQTGSIVVDIWKNTPVNYPPTVDNTITASAKPTIDDDIYSEDSTLEGWDKEINADDILFFNVNSVVNIISCTVNLKLKRK